MNQKEQTKAFMIISNWKKPLGCDVFLQINSGLIKDYVDLRET